MNQNVDNALGGYDEQAALPMLPAPWEISMEGPRWIIQNEGVLGKKAICWMVGDYVQCGRHAKLIQHSPDLLEALRNSTLELQQVLDGLHHGMDREMVELRIKANNYVLAKVV